MHILLLPHKSYGEALKTHAHKVLIAETGIV